MAWQRVRTVSSTTLWQLVTASNEIRIPTGDSMWLIDPPHPLPLPFKVRESTAMLKRIATETRAVVFIVGHVTKAGDVAGPKTVEHAVDTVLTLQGDTQSPYRLLRTTKNRCRCRQKGGGIQQLCAACMGVCSACCVLVHSYTLATECMRAVPVRFKVCRLPFGAAAWTLPHQAPQSRACCCRPTARDALRGLRVSATSFDSHRASSMSSACLEHCCTTGVC
jgi:hypothetical protein